MATEVAPRELKQRLAQGGVQRPVIVDVREPDEFEEWRIDGSLNIPLGRLRAAEELNKLPKNGDIVAVCAHGIRSAGAAQYLRKVGFRAAHLAGGLAAWSRTYDPAVVPLRLDGGLVVQVRRLGKGCASYLIGYQGEAAIVDPSVHTQEYLELAKEHALRIRHVMDTHLHADHVSGAAALARTTGGALHLSPLDQYRLEEFVAHKDGDRINLGDGGLHIEVVHTPGHTKGSTSFLIEGRALLTGDTLFLEGLARPDLHDRADEFAADLYRTYRERFDPLGAGTIILPAHFSQAQTMEFGKGLYATLGSLRKRISLLSAPRAEFLRHVLANLPRKPPNYEVILAINRSGEILEPSAVEGLEEGPNRCALPA